MTRVLVSDEWRVGVTQRKLHSLNDAEVRRAYDRLVEEIGQERAGSVWQEACKRYDREMGR